MSRPGSSIDQTRFLALHSRTNEPLRRYVARTLGRSEGVEDILQEVYLKALSRGLPPEPDAARAYLFRMASNLVVDHWRRGRVRAANADPDPVIGEADPGLGLDLTRVFNRLSIRDRQLVWLAYVEGADRESIGDALGLGAASVRVMLHRAKARLAAAMRAGGYGGSNDADA